MSRILAIILFSITFNSSAQESKIVIKERAMEVANATVNSDWETVIEYTYPKITQAMGGIEQMQEAIANSMQLQKIVFESVEIGEPSDVYKTGDDNLFSIVPQTIFLKMPNGRVKTESYLLAVSENRGQKWYFIDTSQLTMDNIKSMLPNYNMDLIIPPKKQPTLLDE